MHFLCGRSSSFCVDVVVHFIFLFFGPEDVIHYLNNRSLFSRTNIVSTNIERILRCAQGITGKERIYQIRSSVFSLLSFVLRSMDNLPYLFSNFHIFFASNSNFVYQYLTRWSAFPVHFFKHIHCMERLRKPWSGEKSRERASIKYAQIMEI